MRSRLALQLVFAGVLLPGFAMQVCAQAPETPVDAPTPTSDWPKPVKDNRVFTFVTLDQFEAERMGRPLAFDGMARAGLEPTSTNFGSSPKE